MSQTLSYEDVLQTARALDEPDRARLVEELLVLRHDLILGSSGHV